MVPITASNPFKWRRYRGDIILRCVRWYLRYPISLAHMAEMTAERGLGISASCIWRWVRVFGPEMDKRCRRHLRRTTGAGGWMRRASTSREDSGFLYRAVDSGGHTIDFLLTDRRDAAAAKRFFRRALLNDATRCRASSMWIRTRPMREP
jgi:transposase-like protein